jgi:hypothetical protein
MNRRTYNFIRSLGAGYFAIAVNIVYTVASVPLALHYLGKEQFGLWALAQQIIAGWDRDTVLTDSCDLLQDRLAPRPRADDVCIIAVRFTA